MFIKFFFFRGQWSQLEIKTRKHILVTNSRGENRTSA